MVFYFNHWGSKVKKCLIFNTLRKTSWCERCIKKNNWQINETVVKDKTSELHWGWRETGNSKSKQAMKGFDVISRNLDTTLQGMENSPFRNSKPIAFFTLILQCLCREKPAYLHTSIPSAERSQPMYTHTYPLQREASLSAHMRTGITTKWTMYYVILESHVSNHLVTKWSSSLQISSFTLY